MSDETPVVPPSSPGPESAGEIDGTSKLLAVLSYVFWIVAIIVLLLEPYKSQHYTRANAVQALVLGLVIWVLGWIPVIGWIIALVAFVFAIIAILKALKGEIYEVPVVYGFAKSFIDG